MFAKESVHSFWKAATWSKTLFIEGTIENIFVRFSGVQSFLPTAPGEVDVCPARKSIFLVPLALAMPQKN